MKYVPGMILVLTLLTATLGAQPLAPEQEVDLRLRVVGHWGLEMEGATCAENPHRFELSPDGLKLHLRYSKGVDGKPAPEATYKILGKGPSFLRLAMEGEERRTDDGVPVQWDLVLLTPDSYCWHRTDWDEGSCTMSGYRCPPGKG